MTTPPLPSESATSPDGHRAIAFQQLTPAQQHQRLRELAQTFFKLGAIAFGGPAAHVALMDDEVVKRRHWMSREQLLDLIGVTNLLPGPNSTELAIHIGYERAGWKGLFVAGTSFILPAMVLVWGLAILYRRTQSIPEMDWLLYGVKPVMIAIVLQALWKLGRKAIKDGPTTIAAIAVVLGYVFQVHELLLLLLAGLAVMAVLNWRSPAGAFLVPTTGLLVQTTAPLAATTAANAPTALQVFLFFLKVGSVLYGSGYVLLAFLQRDVVERYQWLTSQQLLDAIAIGQLTPGPIFTTATFVGYLVAGNWGALLGTVGIFLPAFLLVGLVNPWVPWLKQSRWFTAFLQGVNAGSLGLMAAVTVTLAQAALVDWLTVLLAIAATVLVFRFKFNSAWLVLGGAIVGFLFKTLIP